MSSSCIDQVNKSLKGFCRRSDANPIEGAKCLGSSSDCTNAYGSKDGTKWCAESNYGCCYRLTPPPDNILPCCLGEKTSFVDCGADWCPLSDACRDTLGSYCGRVENVTNDTCRTFCADPRNKKYCDKAMLAYCARNPNDDLCSCINSKSPAAPACFDIRCTSLGYMTDEILYQSLRCPTYCPDIVGCYATGKCETSDNLIRTHCCSADYPELCIGGGNWLQRLLDRFFPSTESKYVAGTVGSAMLLIIIMVALLY